MATTRWTELSQRNRRLIVAAGVVEGVLKGAALIDLHRRPAAEVRGSRVLWALALTLVNSVGAVPVAYFVHGRRPL
ncbi:MAG: hypothetical protein ABI083_01120 [Lapillicoccus sp.]